MERIQTETENGGARGGELGGALPRQEGIHRHHGIPARTRTRRKCLLAELEKITALNPFPPLRNARVNEIASPLRWRQPIPMTMTLLLPVY